MSCKNFRAGAGWLTALLSLPGFLLSPPLCADDQVTFAKDVAPIFRDKCETCHRPGQGAPMNLRTYEEVRPWAKSIRQRVATKNMPPWYLDQTIGIQQFANDRSLSAAQIATIVKWVDDGAPLGDKKDLPAPKVWADDSGWQFAKIIGREPDFIVKSADWTVPATGQDQWWKPVSDIPVTEERWVRAVEMRPATLAGRGVTHHAVAQLEQFAPASDQDIGGSDGPAPLAEWSIGKTWDAFRPGTGKLIVPGAKLRWDIHYHSVGQPIRDHVELAVYLYPKDQKPEHRTRLVSLYAFTSRNDLDIPPNSIASTQGYQALSSAARIENFQPHMHLRGKAMSLQAILPGGKAQLMLSYVDRFDFNWINNYIYADDAAPVLPKGTILHVTAWYDNTAQNKSNPDPNEWVGYGERQVEEMGHAWVNITPLSDQEYAAWLARPKPPATVPQSRELSASTHFKQVPFERLHESGQSVTPAYEGWWQNPDGTFNLLFGYFNRNTAQALDIPIGPNNRLDPGPPDQGQPTHFLTRRQKGVFTVTVPKDFGDKKITWTIVSNGRTLSVPAHLGAAWNITPLREIGLGNTPPTISFDAAGPNRQGPKPLVVQRTARAGEPLNLTVFAADDNRSQTTKVVRLRLEATLNWLKANGQTAPFATALSAAAADPDAAVATPRLAAAAAAAGADARTIAQYMGGDVTLTWQKYRGPGEVTFAEVQPEVVALPGSAIPVKNVFNGKGMTTATFSQPGDYILRVVANDSSGVDGEDFVCCWTNGEVKVKVE